jgi:hypothetical protein
MARHHDRWTPEMIERLRSLAGTICAREIADQLGFTVSAVYSEMHELKIKGMYRWNCKPSAEVSAYMERYQVSQRKVESIGIERLNRMEETAREFWLKHREPRLSHPTRRRPDLKNDTERIERMMQLAERCA